MRFARPALLLLAVLLTGVPLVCLGLASATGSTAHPVLPLTGRVVDAAHILTPEQEARITAQLAAWERQTHHQMVVVTTPSLGGRPIEGYAIDLFNAWGIGRRDYNDGVAILVAPNERQARISIGYGLERQFPDDWCSKVMQTRMIPRFRSGDWFGGIEAGTSAILTKPALQQTSPRSQATSRK